MLIIDGSVLEGGGQILRMSLGFSALLRKPIRIVNIRSGRKKPGLAAQHLKSIEIVRDITKANVKGLELGSTEIEFSPQVIQKGTYYVDIKTAGSIALILQCALPIALFSDGHITFEIKGGTNCDMAPQIDTMTEIFRPNLEKFGATFDFDLLRRGYFPRGGGHCKIDIYPVRCLNAVNITDFGGVRNFFGWSFVAGSLPIQIGNDMYTGAVSAIRAQHPNCPEEIQVYAENKSLANDNCSGIILGCTTDNSIIGGSGLGNRNKKSAETGRQAAEEILKCTKIQACIDEHMQDQFIIFMALANGVSRIRTVDLTLHTKTAIYIAKLMTNAIFTINEENGTTIIECVGINLQNP